MNDAGRRPAIGALLSQQCRNEEMQRWRNSPHRTQGGRGLLKMSALGSGCSPRKCAVVGNTLQTDLVL